MIQWLFSKCRLVPQRYIMCMTCCLCGVVFRLLQRCQQHAIKKMVIVESPPKMLYVPGSYSCPYKHIRDIQAKQFAQFYWSRSQMEMVSMITMYAEWFTHLPAGVYADLYGGGPVITLSLLLSAIIFTLLPLAAFAECYIFIFMLLLRTFCSGMIIPAATSILTKCAFPNERTTFIGIMYSGMGLGVIVGDLASKLVFLWDSLFYLNSFVAFLSTVMWYYVGQSQTSPTKDAPDRKRIAPYSTTSSTQVLRQIPWLQLITTCPLVILSLLTISQYLLQVSAYLLSHYLQRVLFFYLPKDIMYTGLASDLFHVTFIVCLLSSSLFSDYLLSARLLSLTTVRRLFIFLGTIVPVVLLITASCAGCNSVIVTACLGAMSYFMALAESNIFSTPLDLCPSLAGTLTAVVTVVSDAFGELMYNIIWDMVLSKAYGEIEIWRNAYLMLGGLIVITVLPYLLFPPSEKAWSMPSPSNLETPSRSLTENALSLH